MNTRALCLAAAYGALALSGCTSSTYLAKVNEQPITGKDLKEEFTRRHGGHGSFLAGEIETRKFLDVVIDQKLLIQEAYRLDLGEQADVRKAVENYEAKKAAEYFAKSEIEDRAPTPEQIRQAWERYTMAVFRARQIVVDTRPEAETVYQQVLSGADFETIARTCSVAGSRIYGGNLPFLGWGALDPRWEEVVFSMTPGEISAPFETPDGWEIVQLSEIQVGERPAFEKAATRIEAILKKRMQAARKREVSEFLWAKYHVRTSGDLGPEGLHEALTKTPDARIATWEGGSLTFQDFARQLDWKQLAGQLPGRFRMEIQEQLRRIVNEPLARLEAKQRHYEKAAEVSDAVRRYREDLMERVLYADYVLKNVTVTDDELQAWYEAHRVDFVEPEKRRIAQIVLPSKDEAEEVRKKIAQGEPFEMLVKTRSTDAATHNRMGDLGWITKREATGEFEKVFTLAEGEISEPLPSKFGYHLMRVTKVQPERALAFDEAKEAIHKKVLEKKQRETRAVWIQRLRGASTVKISKSGIRAFVKSNLPDAAPPAPHETFPSHETAGKEKS